VPLIRRQGRQHAARPRRQGPGQPQRKAPREHPRDLSARRAVPEPPRTNCWPRRSGHPAPLRPPARATCSTRRDPFDRFISVLLFVPRERYDSDGARSGSPARSWPKAYGGRVSASYPDLLRTAAGAGPLHHRRDAGRPRRARPRRASRPRSPRPPAPGRTASRAAVRDDSSGRRRGRGPDHPGRPGPRPSRPATATSYDAAEALIDLAPGRGPGGRAAPPVRVRAFRRDGRLGAAASASSSIGRRAAAPLADVLPVLERHGPEGPDRGRLQAVTERAATASARSGSTSSCWRTSAVSVCLRRRAPGLRGRLHRRLDRPDRERRLQPPGAGARRLPAARGGPGPGPGRLPPARAGSTPAARCRKRR
jgi:hypothetical protein